MSNQTPPVGRTTSVSDSPAVAADRLDGTVWTPAGRIDRFGVVLVLIAMTVLADFSSLTAGWAGVLSVTLGAATLVFVFTTADASPRSVAVVRAFALIAIGTAISSVAVGDGHRVPWLISSLGAVLAVVAPVVIGRRLLRQPVISIHTVLGGICLYLLLGLFFAYVFAFVNTQAGPFFAQTSAARMADFVYFSYITMATVGYGDLTPQADLARMLAAADGITGQLFLVTVVAFFLGNLGARRFAAPIEP